MLQQQVMKLAEISNLRKAVQTGIIWMKEPNRH
jgi:hypothetical protein